MINVTFVFNGAVNGRPSWIGYDGATQLTILWNGTYWVMLGWPYDGEPRNYNDTYDPTTGWELYNSTTLTATFNVVLGACPLPSPSPTVTPSKTPTPTPTSPQANCICYTITNLNSFDTTYSYSDCNGVPVSNVKIVIGASASFCALLDSVIFDSEIVNKGICGTSCPPISPSPTPTPTPSQVCNAPSLLEVTFVQRGKINNNDYIFNLFFASDSNCSGMIYEYSCDNITWQTCIYNSCIDSFGCQSPVQIYISPSNFCTTCGASWYFRLKQCCSNGLQSNYSNVIQVLPPSPSPSRTPSVTRTPSRTPSITPTNSVTPSITATPSVTTTPSPSPTPGLCRYITSLNASTILGNFVKIQYTNCAGVLRTFGTYLPTGNNIVDISTLNICMRVGTSLTVTAGSALSIQPIFGAYCS